MWKVWPRLCHMHTATLSTEKDLVLSWCSSPDTAIKSFWLLLAFPATLAPSLASAFLDTIFIDSCFSLSFSIEEEEKSGRKATLQKIHEIQPASLFIFIFLMWRTEKREEAWGKGAFAVIYGRSDCPVRGDEFPEARAAGDMQGSLELSA